jgi:hypothetical protein
MTEISRALCKVHYGHQTWKEVKRTAKDYIKLLAEYTGLSGQAIKICMMSPQSKQAEA